MKIVNSKRRRVGRGLVGRGGEDHGWARMASRVGGAGDLRFEMGLVRTPGMGRESLARGRRAFGERGEYGASRARACTERAGRRTPCAERAVILPAVQSLRLA